MEEFYILLFKLFLVVLDELENPAKVICHKSHPGLRKPRLVLRLMTS